MSVWIGVLILLVLVLGVALLLLRPGVDDAIEDVVEPRRGVPLDGS